MCLYFIDELSGDQGDRELLLPDVEVPGGGRVREGVRGHRAGVEGEGGDKEDRPGHVHQRQVPGERHLFVNLPAEAVQPPQHCEVQGCTKL